MSETRREESAVRLASWGGVVGPIVFVVLVIAGGILTGGYSHVTQKISELGATGAQYALLQNLNFVVLGVSVIGFAWALARVLGGPVHGPLLIGLFGIIVFIHSFLSCDTGCRGETTAGLLHNITGLVGFVAAIAGMIVLARQWRNDPYWRAHVTFTWSAALVSIVGLALFVFTQARDVQSFAGIAQRVFAGALLLWIAVTAARLIGVAAGSENGIPRTQHRDALTRSG